MRKMSDIQDCIHKLEKAILEDGRVDRAEAVILLAFAKSHAGASAEMAEFVTALEDVLEDGVVNSLLEGTPSGHDDPSHVSMRLLLPVILAEAGESFNGERAVCGYSGKKKRLFAVSSFTPSMT